MANKCVENACFLMTQPGHFLLNIHTSRRHSKYILRREGKDYSKMMIWQIILIKEISEVYIRLAKIRYQRA